MATEKMSTVRYYSVGGRANEEPVEFEVPTRLLYSNSTAQRVELEPGLFAELQFTNLTCRYCEQELQYDGACYPRTPKWHCGCGKWERVWGEGFRYTAGEKEEREERARWEIARIKRQYGVGDGN